MPGNPHNIPCLKYTFDKWETGRILGKNIYPLKMTTKSGNIIQGYDWLAVDPGSKLPTAHSGKTCTGPKLPTVQVQGVHPQGWRPALLQHCSGALCWAEMGLKGRGQRCSQMRLFRASKACLVHSGPWHRERLFSLRNFERKHKEIKFLKAEVF